MPTNQVRTTRSGVEYVTVVPTTKSYPVSLDLSSNPVHRHAAKGDMKKDYMTITSTICTDGKKIKSISADLFLKGSATWDDESKDKLEAIFQTLHSAFFAHGQTDIGLTSSAAIDYEASTKINRKPIYEIANEDKSILHRILHALTEGKRLDSARTDSVRFQKVVNTTWAATKMLRNLKQRNLPTLQQFVGFHLLSSNASKLLVELFGQLGISSACTTMRLKDDA